LFQVSTLLVGVTYSSSAKKSELQWKQAQQWLRSRCSFSSVWSLNCLQIGCGSKLHIFTLAGSLLSEFRANGNYYVEVLVKSSAEGD
jgi:hypothetical protein